jgi:hypothetical protein
VVDLCQRVDAAQCHASGAVRRGRVEEQLARRLDVECVAVVTLPGHPVIEVRLRPRALEVIQGCSRDDPTSCGNALRHLVRDRRLAGGGEPVDCNPDSTRTERQDAPDDVVEHCGSRRAAR